MTLAADIRLYEETAASLPAAVHVFGLTLLPWRGIGLSAQVDTGGGGGAMLTLNFAHLAAAAAPDCNARSITANNCDRRAASESKAPALIKVSIAVRLTVPGSSRSQKSNRLR